LRQNGEGEIAMTIREARQNYSAQLSEIRAERQALQKAMQEQEKQTGGNFDRVTFSEELKKLDAAYQATQGVLEKINARSSLIEDTESARQQRDAAIEQAQEMLKCLETARRISAGDKVPAKDEKKLMEFSHELYMSAKNMAFLRAQQEEQAKRKKHDSLWADEDENREKPDSPESIAADTEISVPDAAYVAHSAAAAAETEAPTQE